jgi:hypothetical protein
MFGMRGSGPEACVTPTNPKLREGCLSAQLLTTRGQDLRPQLSRPGDTDRPTRNTLHFKLRATHETIPGTSSEER